MTTTRAGVGHSDHWDSETAALNATRAALANAGTKRCDLALVFSTYRHDQERVLAAVRSVVGAETRILGGGTAGIITNDYLGYEGAQIGVCVLSSETLQPRLFRSSGLSADERAAGRALGQQVRECLGAAQSPVVLMYESVKEATPEGPILNMGTPLLEGMKAGLEEWPPIVGLGLHGDPQWKPGLGYFDAGLEKQSAMAFALLGDVRMDTVTITNLKPMSSYKKVTKTSGPALLEIEGRPAFDVIAELVGPHLVPADYPLNLTLGVNRGKPFGEYNEEDYAIHLCVAVDVERHAIIVDNLLAPGMDIQLMRRQIDFAEIRQKAQQLVSRTAGRTPFLALYIDCAGRASVYAGTDREEAAEIQAAIGRDMPLFGLYSGGEISRMGGEVRRLTNAGVLSIFSE